MRRSLGVRPRLSIRIANRGAGAQFPAGAPPPCFAQSMASESAFAEQPRGRRRRRQPKGGGGRAAQRAARTKDVRLCAVVLLVGLLLEVDLPSPAGLRPRSGRSPLRRRQAGRSAEARWAARPRAPRAPRPGGVALPVCVGLHFRSQSAAGSTSPPRPRPSQRSHQEVDVLPHVVLLGDVVPKPVGRVPARLRGQGSGGARRVTLAPDTRLTARGSGDEEGACQGTAHTACELAQARLRRLHAHGGPALAAGVHPQLAPRLLCPRTFPWHRLSRGSLDAHAQALLARLSSQQQWRLHFMC